MGEDICRGLPAEFSELDWPLIIGAAQSIGIDDVDFHFLEGEFGKVTIEGACRVSAAHQKAEGVFRSRSWWVRSVGPVPER